MKTIFTFFLCLGFSAMVVYGQSPSTPKHRIVFQMVSKDSADHNALVRQISNILKLEPAASVEVVCHGPGLQFIQKGKSLVLDKLTALAVQKVDFVGCEFTMQQKNVKREQLLDACRTVPGGILEIVYRQEEGWSYIKAGY
jgi:intracellular sulfur oxidation DsrE/DsrF family protein